MLTQNMQPSTIISLIKQCKTLRTLKLIHAAMIRSHLHSNLYFTTNLITHYSSLGSISHSYILFSQSHSQDLFLYNVMIQCLSTHSNHQKSISLYRQMKVSGIKPDNFTFPFVLKSYGYLGNDRNVGGMIHKDVVQFGYELDLYVGNSVISMYSKLGQVELCRKVFDEMLERTVVSWNVMVGAYALNGFYQEGLSLFYTMLRDGILPNKAAFLNVMRCVRNEDDACDIGRFVVDYGWEADQSVQSAMMGVYSRCGCLDIARRIFDEIGDKDIITWSSMIEGYAQAELPIEALELFKQMRLNRMEIDFVTILSVIRATSSLASFRQSRFLHGTIVRSSQQSVLVVETSLVDLYVKSGSLEYARRVFDRMRDKNLLTWSSMISGYGMHGRGKEALDLFVEMKVSVQPDQITFVSVLSACSHSGLVDEGWKCFRSMTKDFGLAPRSEHYACMVDLLGRSGRLSEARELIETMPIKPDSTVWGSLLGACRIHSNVELAELAAKSLFELDPENPGRYVLLSNIYKSSGKKEEAAQVRSLMKQRNVRKIAGHTIIEVKNMMYTFVIGDRSNPQTELIYKELEILIEKIREEGYIPDTNFVLHDVDEEMKEKMLYVHSEKLAIVFGLLNSAPTSVIRIKKNLRVCGDCHSATKFISKVTKREIVVRDAHRFHHFKEGVCSCGDYW